MKTQISTTHAPSPGTSPHSQAIAANGFIFTQGVIYLTSAGKLLESTIEDQVHLIMKNLSAILTSADVAFGDVVKTTIYVTDMTLYPSVNTVYASYFTSPYPARETVCVHALPLGAKVEISMIATTR